MSRFISISGRLCDLFTAREEEMELELGRRRSSFVGFDDPLDYLVLVRAGSHFESNSVDKLLPIHAVSYALQVGLLCAMNCEYRIAARNSFGETNTSLIAISFETSRRRTEVGSGHPGRKR